MVNAKTFLILMSNESLVDNYIVLLLALVGNISQLMQSTDGVVI